MSREIEDRIIELSNVIEQSHWNIDDWVGDMQKLRRNRESVEYICWCSFANCQRDTWAIL